MQALSPCTSNLFVLRCLLCSKKPANWPIFKFYISNVFLSKFYFPSTVHCIFSAWEREPGEILTLIEFYWIILFSGWALPSLKQSIFQCIFITKQHVKFFFLFKKSKQFVKGLFKLKTLMKIYWLNVFSNHFSFSYIQKYFENKKYSYVYKKVEYLELKIGSIVLIHC